VLSRIDEADITRPLEVYAKYPSAFDGKKLPAALRTYNLNKELELTELTSMSRTDTTNYNLLQ